MPVQSAIASQSVAQNTAVVTLPNPTVSGDQIVLCLMATNTAVISSIVDSQGNQYTQVGPTNLNSGGSQASFCFIATNIIGGASNTITITFTGTAKSILAAIEYNDIDNAIPFELTSTSQAVGGTPTTSLSGGTTGATTQAVERIIAFGGALTGAGGPFTAGGSFTIEQQISGSGQCMAVEDFTTSSTGTQTATMTATSNIQWQMGIHTFHTQLVRNEASVVQSAMNSSSVFVSSIAVALPNPVSPSNVLMVGASVSFTTGTQSLTISDNLGNVYTLVRGLDAGTGGGQSILSAIWIVKNPIAGTPTITVSCLLNGSPDTEALDIGVMEISNLSSNPVDQTKFGTGTVQPLNSGTTGTTAQAFEFGFGFGALRSQATSRFFDDANMGIVKQQNNGFHASVLTRQRFEATGTFAASVLSVTSNDWVLSLVTLEVAPPATSIAHNVDCEVGLPVIPFHLVDCYIQSLGNKVHSVDAWISPVSKRQFVNLAMNLQFPIQPNAFLKLAGTIASQQLNFLNLAGTIRAQSETFLELAGTIQSSTRSFVKLAGSIQNHTLTQHSVDAVVSTQSIGFIQLNGTIRGAIGPGPCGSFPDASYVKLAGWIVSAGDSIQMPNSGFTRAEDWLSSQDALASYKPVSLFQLAGINLIITAFTTGVISWQTRTRSWLRRIDAAPNGVLLTTKVNTHTLPNGAVITTTTQVFQIQDTIKTVITIQNSATPTRFSTMVTEETKSGQKSVRESETKNENGVSITTTKNVFTKPPTTENIQPLRVTTLDGVQHYQFFGVINQEWAGGEQEGTTNSSSITSIQGTSKTVKEVTDTPDGKHEEITTVVQGSNEAGTTVTDTTENYVGLQTTVHKVVTFPNKSQEITDTVTVDTPSDSHSISTEVVTDEYGQVTTTVTDTETKTFTDPQTGLARTQITKTVTVTKGGVTTTDTTVETTDDFENDIVNQKVQVYLIQEFTINCVIDEMNMFALWEINETHQQNFALLELFGQQLSNATLSYAFRQNLIKQFNAANSCIKPVTLQANGRTYQVVFAPSASGFRAKFIPGTEPHVYELQLILQERSNMINGTQGFF